MENGFIKYQVFNPFERCNFRLHLEMIIELIKS